MDVHRFGGDFCGIDCSAHLRADHTGHQFRTLLRHLSAVESRLRLH